jgi:hypothetical protein
MKAGRLHLMVSFKIMTKVNECNFAVYYNSLPLCPISPFLLDLSPARLFFHARGFTFKGKTRCKNFKFNAHTIDT